MGFIFGIIIVFAFLVLFIIILGDWIFNDLTSVTRFFKNRFGYEVKLRRNDCGCYNCKWCKVNEHTFDTNYRCLCPTDNKKNCVTGVIEPYHCANCFGNRKLCKWEPKNEKES